MTDDHPRPDLGRREISHSGGEDARLLRPHVNRRTLVFERSLSTRIAKKIVGRWAGHSRIGNLFPHGLRRAAITKAFDSSLTYRQVQMMSGHRDPKAVMNYDHGRENLGQNAVNFVSHEEG